MFSQLRNAVEQLAQQPIRVLDGSPETQPSEQRSSLDMQSGTRTTSPLSTGQLAESAISTLRKSLASQRSTSGSSSQSSKSPATSPPPPEAQASPRKSTLEERLRRATAGVSDASTSSATQRSSRVASPSPMGRKPSVTSVTEQSSARRAESPARRAESPVRRAESPAPARRLESVASRRAESPVRRAESPVRRAETPTRRAESPVRRAESPVTRRAESPVRRTDSPARRAESPVRRVESPLRRAESPARRSGSPLVTSVTAAKKPAQAPKKPAGVGLGIKNEQADNTPAATSEEPQTEVKSADTADDEIQATESTKAEESVDDSSQESIEELEVKDENLDKNLANEGDDGSKASEVKTIEPVEATEDPLQAKSTLDVPEPSENVSDLGPAGQVEEKERLEGSEPNGSLKEEPPAVEATPPQETVEDLPVSPESGSKNPAESTEKLRSSLPSEEASTVDTKPSEEAGKASQAKDPEPPKETVSVPSEESPKVSENLTQPSEANQIPDVESSLNEIEPETQAETPRDKEAAEPLLANHTTVLTEDTKSPEREEPAHAAEIQQQSEPSPSTTSSPTAPVVDRSAEVESLQARLKQVEQRFSGDSTCCRLMVLELIGLSRCLYVFQAFASRETSR